MAQLARGLFVDTSAFYARFDGDDANHDLATQAIEGLGQPDQPWRPVLTSGYVLGELSGLLLRYGDPETASRYVERVRTSDLFQIQHPDTATFMRACDQHHAYRDQAISLVDHLSAVIATERDITHILTFDGDDFRTLGLTPVPEEMAIGD